MEVSAKGNINVEKAFFTLATQIKKRIIDTQGSTGAQVGAGSQRSSTNVNVGAAGEQPKGGCC